MIYFLHNSQTGRVQQSPSLEQFEGPDRSVYEHDPEAMVEP